jgi:putative transposase
MSRKYKFSDQDKLYFISTAVVNWIDVFTRTEYKDIVIESLKFCQKEKALEVYAYCLMTNHIHLIIGSTGKRMEETLRDMKQFTAKKILKAIEDNSQESKKEWMLWMFERAGKRKAGNDKYQFWQHDNHPIVLENARIMKQKLDYIHRNPVTAGFVENPEDWLYSSAKNYYTTDLPILEVILIE